MIEPLASFCAFFFLISLLVFASSLSRYFVIIFPYFFSCTRLDDFFKEFLLIDERLGHWQENKSTMMFQIDVLEVEVLSHNINVQR